MVFCQTISAKLSAYISYLQRESSLSYREIARCCDISASSAVRICKDGFLSQDTKNRSGRPPRLTSKDKARFIRTFQKMRDENPNVRVIDVAKECEITNASYRTLVHPLNDAGYWWLTSRRKGLLSAIDRKKRVQYARAALRDYDRDFWTYNVLLYLDGVSFRHNHRPYQDALCAGGKYGEKVRKVLSSLVKDRRIYQGVNLCTYWWEYAIQGGSFLQRNTRS